MRARIVRLTVALAALTITVFGVPLAAAVAQFLLADRYTAIEQAADAAALAASGDLTRAVPSVPAAADDGVQVAVYDGRGARISGTGPDHGVPLISDALRGISGDGMVDGRLGVAAPVSDGDAVVGAVLATSSRSAVYAEIGGVWLGMLALAATALLIAWLLARRQAGLLVRPLRSLSEVAERLGGGDFSVRTQPAGITEIDSLTESVNRTAIRLGALVDRERSFSADASHQLRTPLTGLRMQLELALDQPGADLRAAIVAALSSTDRLESTIEELLLLARDLPQPSTAFDAHDFVEDLRRRWHPLLAARGRPLRLMADSAPQVQIRLGALTQIMDVLIDNAERHGLGAVTVTVRGLENAVAIDVADQGPRLSLDPEVLFQRRAAQASGYGIGLALARRLAESQGGRLRLTDTDPPTFTLLLPVTSSAPPADDGPATPRRPARHTPGPPS
ncbi:MAG: HAMP domain-containing sensor histidine kinase [Nakamurella sp.]